MLNDNLQTHSSNDTNKNAYNLETDIFNTIIGFEDNQKNDTKRKRSEKVTAARKAIEVHRENKKLASYLSDSYNY